MGRFYFCPKTGLKKGAWTPEEDTMLSAYIQKYGHWNWRELPKFAGLSRCGKSCRLRWKNYLQPNIKRGNYTREEEELIIKLHQKYGNRWSAIAASLPGRTDNEIKNRWNTHLKKRSKSNSTLEEAILESETLRRTVFVPDCVAPSCMQTLDFLPNSLTKAYDTEVATRNNESQIASDAALGLDENYWKEALMLEEWYLPEGNSSEESEMPFGAVLEFDGDFRDEPFLPEDTYIQENNKSALFPYNLSNGHQIDM